MKFLCTIAFLLAFAFGIYVGYLKHQRTLKNIHGKTKGIVTYVLSTTILVIGFIQFWLLTGIFPYYVILFLIGASLIGMLIYNFIGAIAGFSLQQQKVQILGLVWGVQRPMTGCVLITSSVLTVGTIVFGSLYIYWKMPVRAPEAVGWIAFFLFILPHVVGTLNDLALSSPMMTSEFVDEDVRNSLISARFSSIIYSIVALVFPVWIFEEQIGKTFGWLPSYGLLLSIPLLLFLVGGILPYFVGMYQYRSKARALLEWRRNWLHDVDQLLDLPEGQNRSDLWQEKLDELKAEITARTQENEFLGAYERFLAKGAEGADALSSPSSPSPTNPISDEADGAKSSNGSAEPESDVARISLIIEEHKDKLRDWDIRFRDVDKLHYLFRSISGVPPESIRKFVEGNFEDVNAEIGTLKTQRNILAGTSLTIISAAGSWVFRTYQDPIMKMIANLAGLG
jgi:hypothetical protein